MEPIITKEAIQELQKSLTPVVEKLGKGGEWVYSVYYKQQIVYAISYSLWILVGLALLILGIVGFIKIPKCKTSDDQSFLFLVSCVAVIIGFMVVFTNVEPAVGRLINPDYYILQDLLSIIKK